MRSFLGKGNIMGSAKARYFELRKSHFELARGLGLEPRSAAPKAAVLPIGRPPNRWKERCYRKRPEAINQRNPLEEADRRCLQQRWTLQRGSCRVYDLAAFQ